MVASVSVVSDKTPDSVRQRHRDEYDKHNSKHRSTSNTQPHFQLYMYDSEGDMVRKTLSLHEIQQILLLRSRRFGLPNDWLKDQVSSEEDEEEQKLGQSVVNRVHDIVAAAQQVNVPSYELPGVVRKKPYAQVSGDSPPVRTHAVKETNQEL